MRLVVPELENITVQSVGGFVTPQFRIFDPGSATKSHTFNVSQMSDGTLRILGLLVALYQDPRPSIIALEEPELTVHPGVLQLISDSILEVAETTQILVTTHSPVLIDKFDPSHVFAVESKGGVTVARPLSNIQKDAVKKRLFSLGELMTVEGLHA